MMSQLFVSMETGSKQYQVARGSVITTIVYFISARLHPTARSLVQGFLAWDHQYAI